MFLLLGLINPDPTLGVFQLVLGASGLVLALWPRLVLTADGVTIVNLRARKLRWEEIDAVGVRQAWYGVNLVFKTGGGEARAFAMRGAAKGMLGSRELLDRLAAELDEERRRRTGPLQAAAT
jgi:hypothetical protein